MEKVLIALDAENALDVSIVEGSFDQGVTGLKKRGLEVMTGAELAEARIRGGPQSPVAQRGFWIAENTNYLPNSDVLFADRRYNPLLKSPKEATQAHREGCEFYLEAQVVKELEERAETDVEKALQSGVLRVSRANLTSPIPTSRFGEEARTRFLFREHAQDYGAWLQEQGINAVSHYNPNAENKALGRPVWVNDLDYWSNIVSNSNLYNLNGRVGGVRRVPAIAGAPEKAPSAEQSLNVETSRIMTALKEGVAFEYQGSLYIPVRREVIERAR